jgi:hypothetical protein
MQDSKELDDFEILVYANLKSWRLKLHRELAIEPYKIFQNRTLCELVRRRRNDPTWAREVAENPSDMPNPSPRKSPKKIKKESDEGAAEAKAEEGEPSPKVIDDLLMCWGVGPSKVRWPEGFAHEALAVLNDPANAKLLHKSLALQS